MSAVTRLESMIGDTDDVFVSRHENRVEYLRRLEEGLRKSLCEPFELRAQVTEIGINGFAVGDRITGTCVAEANGYWLAYFADHDNFVIFWGADKEDLGAPGIEGSPLACWSA
jgi:hypothetical protein